MKYFQKYVAGAVSKIFDYSFAERETRHQYKTSKALIQPRERGIRDTGFQFHLKNPDRDHILLLQKPAMTKQTAARWEDGLCYSQPDLSHYSNYLDLLIGRITFLPWKLQAASSLADLNKYASTSLIQN